MWTTTGTWNESKSLVRGTYPLKIEERWRTNEERRRTVQTFAKFFTENVTETFRKRLGLDFLHGNNFSKQIRKREKCQRGWTLFFFTSSPIYSKIGEVVAAQASSARPGEPGCFLQKQQPSGGIFWRAQVGLGAICTPIFTKYTPLCYFLVILFS